MAAIPYRAMGATLRGYWDGLAVAVVRTLTAVRRTAPATS
jgi:hypothetical protein